MVSSRASIGINQYHDLPAAASSAPRYDEGAAFPALVQVEAGFAREPVYIQRFVQREPGFAETAVVFNLAELLSLADRAA